MTTSTEQVLAETLRRHADEVQVRPGLLDRVHPRARRIRRRRLGVVLVAIVLGSATAALALTGAHRPSAAVPGRAPVCQDADLRLHTGGSTLETTPIPQQVITVSITTDRSCRLTGPVRLVTRTLSGAWVPIQLAAGWDWAHTPGPIGITLATTRAQTLTITPAQRHAFLIASTSPRSTPPCLAKPMAISFAGSVLLSLDQPTSAALCSANRIAVSAIFLTQVSVDVPWRNVQVFADGRTLTVHYPSRCRPPSAHVTQTPRAVTIILTGQVPAAGTVFGCLPILSSGDSTLTIRLNAPLGSRTILHGSPAPNQDSTGN